MNNIRDPNKIYTWWTDIVILIFISIDGDVPFQILFNRVSTKEEEKGKKQQNVNN